MTARHRDKDVPDLLDLAHSWFNRYEACIRSRDTKAAQELFHPKAVGFGLITNRADCPASFELDWRHWKDQLVFTFDISSAAIFPSQGAIMIALNWSANPLVIGGPRKEGRGTYMFVLFDNGKFSCLHEHLSENPE